MKLNKFIIPVGISLAAFIWGYRGELWMGKIHPDQAVSPTPVSEVAEGNIKKNQYLSPNTTAGSSGPISPPGPMPGGAPIKARELPLTTPGPGDEYAPEDDGQEEEDVTEEGDEEGVDPEADQADDQSLPEDEAGADSPENEEVDSNSNEGDLEEDESADTAETKPVKP